MASKSAGAEAPATDPTPGPDAPERQPVDPGAFGADYSKLVDQATGEHPEAWIPNHAGDLLAGRYLRLGRAYTTFGECPVVVMAVDHQLDQNGQPVDAGGELRSVFLLQTALRSQFVQLRPEPGDRIVVACLGKRQGPRYSYLDFRVTSDAPARGYGWDDVAGMDAEPGDGTDADPDAPPFA